jgi:hypothetical protein
MYEQSLKEVTLLAELSAAVHASEPLPRHGRPARTSSRVRLEIESSLSSQSHASSWMNSDLLTAARAASGM